MADFDEGCEPTQPVFSDIATLDLFAEEPRRSLATPMRTGKVKAESIFHDEEDADETTASPTKKQRLNDEWKGRSLSDRIVRRRAIPIEEAETVATEWLSEDTTGSTPSVSPREIGHTLSERDAQSAVFSASNVFVVNEIVAVPRASPALHYGKVITINEKHSVCMLLLSSTEGVQKALPSLLIGKLGVAATPTADLQLVRLRTGIDDLLHFSLSHRFMTVCDCNETAAQIDSNEDELKLSQALMKTISFLMAHHAKLLHTLAQGAVESLGKAATGAPSTRRGSDLRVARALSESETVKVNLQKDLDQLRELRLKSMEILHLAVKAEESTANLLLGVQRRPR